MKTEINDGGPAFPVGFQEFDQRVHGKAPYVGNPGMSLRDYFAAKAMQEQIGYEGMEGCDKEHICAMAYELADAMLDERQKQSEAKT